MAMHGFGAVFGILYLVVVAAVTVLAIWALVLLIIFLRLRINELRAAPGGAGDPGPSR